ncbi:hypothetical protein A0J61_10668, partial [Choanephora cucurbitarum]
MKKKLMRGKFDHCCNDNVIILCHLLMKRATRDDGEDDDYSEGASFELFLLNEKTEAIKKKDNDKILLVDIFGSFYKKIFFMSSLTEQSHIESTLMPFIETFFNCIPSTEHLSARGQLEELPESSNLLLPICKSSSATSTSTAATTASRKRSRASSSLSSSPSWLSLFPDYLLKIVSEGEKFDVLAAEIKKPNSKSSQIVNDRVKLGNLLKLMLDRLVLAGVPSPLVCGFVDDGDVIETYKMSIEQEGRYDFVQLASFRGIRCLEDLACLPNMLNHFQQLKNIVLHMKEVIRVTRLNEVIPGPFSLSLPVPVAWLRPSLEYPALEACSKKQNTEVPGVSSLPLNETVCVVANEWKECFDRISELSASKWIKKRSRSAENLIMGEIRECHRRGQHTPTR